MLVLGLDIGGANLKAATSDGDAADRPFPLWKHPERLEDELRSLIASFPRAGAIAVTMTGELADCFPSKAEGVRAIAAAVNRAVAARSRQIRPGTLSRSLATGRAPAHAPVPTPRDDLSNAGEDPPVLFWQTGGESVGPDEAAELPRLVAAANWHALATFCGRVVPTGPALLIDVGSTTTDIVPLRDGAVAAEGLTDLERLRSGELVYTGATRTPVCAIASSVSIEGTPLPLAAELFATTKDVYLLRGAIPENADDRDTADGRPATIAGATSRLARMACADPDEIGGSALRELADAIAARQREAIATALGRVLGRFEGEVPHLLLSGSGSFIADRVVSGCDRLSGAPITSLAKSFANRVSRSACAFAVARLAAERLPA